VEAEPRVAVEPVAAEAVSSVARKGTSAENVPRAARTSASTVRRRATSLEIVPRAEVAAEAVVEAVDAAEVGDAADSAAAEAEAGLGNSRTSENLLATMMSSCKPVPALFAAFYIFHSVLQIIFGRNFKNFESHAFKIIYVYQNIVRVVEILLCTM